MCPVSTMVMKTTRISGMFAKIAPKRGRKSPKYYQTTLEYFDFKKTIANTIGFMKLWIMNFYFLKGSVEISQ
jgi:hypothetical protein